MVAVAGVELAASVRQQDWRVACDHESPCRRRRPTGGRNVAPPDWSHCGLHTERRKRRGRQGRRTCACPMLHAYIATVPLPSSALLCFIA
ncbi:hypothetical protein GUJ93_ZPchr0458g22831 [Zizania palustris]|uniref:Uncharacterized protein n=1 Tax=Zizania palustris TaxID=103762 RepID=A0A8J5RSJ6_ZIZPA|nr:hypothetical protein GUJ93_ZPchr0458g22831 [Zizania palustris]